MKFALDLEASPDGMVRLAILVDDEVVWPHPNHPDGTAEFDPEDVVSFLADAWPALLLQQFWPIAFGRDQEPRSVTGLFRAANERWELLTDEEARLEAPLIDQFLYDHDLSQMKHGAGLASCFMLRQQSWMTIEVGNHVFERIHFTSCVTELTRLGQFSANLLRQRDDAVAGRVMKRWADRDRQDPLILASLISGLSCVEISTTAALQDNLIASLSGRSLHQIANDNKSPIYAAARSSGVLGPVSLADILYRVQQIPAGDGASLASVRRQLLKHLREAKDPTNQGIRAASYIRDWLEQQNHLGVDLNSLAKRLQIAMHEAAMPDDRLDGIATIGPDHGPAILLNLNTRRQGAGPDDLRRSLNFIWAHEIGHLLLDQEDWPALIDAVRQRVPRDVETRANAFAAYLLLPPAVAYRVWEEANSPLNWTGILSPLDELTETYRLPRIVASRQLARGAPLERRRVLEEIFRVHIRSY